MSFLGGLPNPASSKDRTKTRAPAPGYLAFYLPRRLQFLLALIAIPSCLWLLYSYFNTPSVEASRFVRGGDPPNYYEWHEREKALPQNDASLPAPQGREGRYLRFKNHLTTVGWGNSMQEMLINHHLAYRSNRIFVMYNYTWDKHAEGDYSQFGDNKIPARIPISALAAGPLAGEPYPAGDWRPPAVTTEFFEEVCPHPTLVHVGDTRGPFSESSASTILDAFLARLDAIPDNCVELQENTGEVFDFYIFGDGARMADVWPQLTSSPVLAAWAWSPLVAGIVSANRALIHPALRHADTRQRAHLPGLLALHLRRGDFEEHCARLSDWKSTYNAFNVRPDFPDQFVAPEGGGGGVRTEHIAAWFRTHCFPDISQIVERVLTFRKDAAAQGRRLDRIYMLTNGRREWLAELRAELNKVASWKSIVTSRDLVIDWEQEFVKQAADMLIATRAEVFVGNAWSSLSSNVNLLRISQMHEPETSRFW